MTAQQDIERVRAAFEARFAIYQLTHDYINHDRYFNPDTQTLWEAFLAGHQAALAAMQPEAGWRSMESAPRDGTEFLSFASDRPAGKEISVIFWRDEFGWCFFDDGNLQLGTGDKITHWQPLPPAPQQTDGGAS